MTKRPHAFAALTVTVGAIVLAMAAPAAADRAPAPGTPDPVTAIDAWLACRAGAEPTTVAWTVPPTGIAVDDPAGDVTTPDGSPPPSTPPGDSDITGWVHATTGPLDDDVFDRLFGAGGLLDSTADGVMPPTYEIDTEAFRPGIAITGVRLAGPRQPAATTEDTSGVALLGFDPRYPTPSSGNFSGVNKAWRLDTSQAGDHVAYLQYTGQNFQEFHSDMLISDGCSQHRQHPARPGPFR